MAEGYIQKNTNHIGWRLHTKKSNLPENSTFKYENRKPNLPQNNTLKYENTLEKSNLRTAPSNTRTAAQVGLR
jgi:hypothetical protein